MAVAVRINGQDSGDWLLIERSGRLHATEEALRDWRLRLPVGAGTLNEQGQTWIELNQLAGFASDLDEANDRLDLQFDPEAFELLQVSRSRMSLPITAAREHAVFLNYDASVTRSDRRSFSGSTSSSSLDLGALVELGWTGPWGFATSSHALRRSSSGGDSIQRLETSFTRDDAETNLTCRFGDSSTRASLWGPPAYFAGVQVGRNLRLNPAFISQPVPVLAGTASAPSTLELYVNDVLQQTSQVPAGPFSLGDATGLTSGGQARLVLRDALGRETVVVRDFISQANLLEEGLGDWSVEAGALRRGFGPGEGYGDAFTSGIWRQGLSKTLTSEGRLELSSQRRAAGVGLSAAIDRFWFVQAALARSRTEHLAGQRWAAQVEADPLRQRLALRIERSSRAFRSMGQDERLPPSRQQLSASMALLTGREQSLRLLAGRIDAYDAPATRTLGMIYSRNLAQGGYLSVSAQELSTPGRAIRSLVATWTIPWDSLKVSSLVSRREGRLEGIATAARNPLLPEDPGWRVSAGHRNGSAVAEASVFQQRSRAWLSADVSGSREQQTVRLGARGALVAMDGSAFATARLDESFALVEVPSYADVGVGFMGRNLGSTDARGRALVPSLQAFTSNYVRLDANALPVTAELESMEQSVTPGRRSAVRVQFPVRSGRGALVRINLDDGEPAPLGAGIEIEGGDGESFMVARNGEAFLTGLRGRDRLLMRWRGRSCRLEIALPEGSEDEVPRIGPLACRGVPR